MKMKEVLQKIQDNALRETIKSGAKKSVLSDLNKCECGGKIIRKTIRDPHNTYYLPEESTYCEKCGWKNIINRFMPPIWTRYRASEISRHSKTIQNKLEMFPEDPRNLLINGKVGRGKTDLAFCLIKKFIEYKAKKEFKKYSMTVPKVFITEALLLIRNVKKIYKDSDEFEFFRSGYDFYFIDGIGDSIPTDDAYCIEQIINYLYIHDKQFIITTNLSPEQFGQRYGERVASRLSECATSLELKGKDWRIPK